MKNIVLLMILVIVTSGFSGATEQAIPTYPIPSYNIPVTGLADFREAGISQYSKQKREKRVVNVEVKCVPGSQGQATIWIYSLDQTTVLGPYIVSCGETLSVEIDDREWGVLVQSNEEVIVDVWITG